MHLSDVVVLTFAIVGITSFIAPMDEPDPELWNAFIMVGRICIIIVLIDILPRIAKKLGKNDLTDILLVILPCGGVLIAINYLNPDIDPNILESIGVIVVFALMLTIKISRRHFIKKNGYLVASSEKDEIRN